MTSSGRSFNGKTSLVWLPENDFLGLRPAPLRDGLGPTVDTALECGEGIRELASFRQKSIP